MAIAARYLSTDFIEEFRTRFASESPVCNSGYEIIVHPFKVAILSNFLQARVVEKLVVRCGKLPFSHKQNDLYDFYQSCDLASLPKKSESLRSAVSALSSSEWRTTLSKMTGLELGSTMDISAQLYVRGNRLLCHDDMCMGRRIAFILYLVDKDWREDDGGALDLFGSEKGHPDRILRSIVPKQNTLVFFEVTPLSFHQVAEILSDKHRRSISGWYHDPQTISGMMSPIAQPTYLDRRVIRSIAKVFKKDRVVELQHFAKAAEPRHRLLELETASKWISAGPANYRQYRCYSGADKDQIVAPFLALKKSFESIVGCVLGDAESTVMLFSPGDYQVFHDQFVESYGSIDVYYFLSRDENWTEQMGGSIGYLSEERVDIIPHSNSLWIIERTRNTKLVVDYLRKSYPYTYLCILISFRSRF